MDCLRGFSGVEHGELPGNPEVIEEMFTILGILLPLEATAAKTTQESTGSLLVLSLYGEAEVTITDALGNSVGPDVSEISGAEYVSLPDSPYKLVLIPNPVDGEFEIQVQGTGDGQYALSLLEESSAPAAVITDAETLWDIAQSEIQTDVCVTYEMTYAEETSDITPLIAVTPMIESPIYLGQTVVEGRALPGKSVEIRDARSGVLVGSGVVNSEGFYQVTLDQPLQLDQQIYPRSENVSGATVTVQGNRVFIPLIQR